MKTLATVRTLALPVIVGQLNIARKQVNVVNAVGEARERTIANPEA